MSGEERRISFLDQCPFSTIHTMLLFTQITGSIIANYYIEGKSKEDKRIFKLSLN